MATATPTTPPVATAPARPLGRITQPVNGATVSGAVQVIGIAAGPGFTGYVLEFAPGPANNATNWQQIQASNTPTPAQGGPLGTWQATALPEGLYTLRLTVLSAGDSVSHSIQVQLRGG